MKFLFVDTETHSLDDARPVEYGAVLLMRHRSKDRTRLATLSSLVRPAGWVISKGARDVHGITMSDCRQNGHNLVDVYRQFCQLSRTADVIVGHNLRFDMTNIERDARYLKCSVPEWPRLRYDTMRELATYCCLPKPRGYRWPKLEELYECVFNKGMPVAHRALDDCLATADCFFALLDAGMISESRFASTTSLTLRGSLI